MNIPYVMKRCSKCGRWLVANNVNFAKDKRLKSGLRASCKECKNKYSKEYKEQNRNKVLEQQKEYDKNIMNEIKIKYYHDKRHIESKIKIK